MKVASSGGGTVQINEDTAGTMVTKTVAAGTEVPIHAIADGGHQFSKWSDNDTNEDRTITVNSDTTLTASFANLYE